MILGNEDYEQIRHNDRLWWTYLPIVGNVLAFIFPYYFYQFVNEDITEMWWCGWFTNKQIKRW